VAILIALLVGAAIRGDADDLDVARTTVAASAALADADAMTIGRAGRSE